MFAPTLIILSIFLVPAIPARTVTLQIVQAQTFSTTDGTPVNYYLIQVLTADHTVENLLFGGKCNFGGSSFQMYAALDGAPETTIAFWSEGCYYIS